jgi:hypothetical protein
MRKSKSSGWGAEGDFANQEAKALVRMRREKRALRDGRTARVIDRSGSSSHLEHAAKALKHVPAKKRVLSAPQWDMEKAVTAMKRAGVSGVVSNLCGSRRIRVKV